MKREACIGTGPIVRGLHFRVVRGRSFVSVSKHPNWQDGDEGVVVLQRSEVLPFLDLHLAVEARVAGLEVWVLECSADDEARVARAAIQWAENTRLSPSFRARWRDKGRAPGDATGNQVADALAWGALRVRT